MKNSNSYSWAMRWASFEVFRGEMDAWGDKRGNTPRLRYARNEGSRSRSTLGQIEHPLLKAGLATRDWNRNGLDYRKRDGLFFFLAIFPPEIVRVSRPRQCALFCKWESVKLIPSRGESYGTEHVSPRKLRRLFVLVWIGAVLGFSFPTGFVQRIYCDNVTKIAQFYGRTRYQYILYPNCDITTSDLVGTLRLFHDK